MIVNFLIVLAFLIVWLAGSFILYGLIVLAGRIQIKSRRNHPRGRF